jgi:hypothetical protein
MMMQLLQRGFNPPPPGGAAQPPDPAFLAGAAIGGCVALGFMLVAFVAFVFVMIRAMQALQECRKRNRTMEPGMVWLSLIPILGVVWNFFVVTKTADALANEYDDRGLRPVGDNGKSLGMTYAVLFVVNAAVGFVGLCVPFVGCANLILFVVQAVVGFLYAGKLKAATEKLKRSGDSDDNIDDDYDDRPRKKRRKPARDEDDDDFEEYDDTDNDRPRRLR